MRDYFRRAAELLGNAGTKPLFAGADGLQRGRWCRWALWPGSNSRADDGRGNARAAARALLQATAESDVPLPRPLDQRTTHGGGEPVADEESPEPIRALVEVGHGQVRQHRFPIERPARPDQGVREQMSAYDRGREIEPAQSLAKAARAKPTKV